ncbi:sugar transferase [Mucilaginibacter gynuensis]|uniref:Sugar transferase n=1 Tax=Mucilaginibacter gynuensis TaxID=1302236 RepID=A0ABP8GMT4_9SPHI
MFSTIQAHNLKPRLISKIDESLKRFVKAVTYHIIIIGSIIYFFKLVNISRLEMIAGYFLFFVLVLVSRLIIYVAVKLQRNRVKSLNKILIIGNEDIAIRFVDIVASSKDNRYDLVDFIAASQVKRGSFDNLKKTILDQRPEEIFICLAKLDQHLCEQLMQFGEIYHIKINIVPALAINNDSFSAVINYGDIPVDDLVAGTYLSLDKRVLKRGFDVFFSTCIMIAGAPFFVALLCLTKLTSRGPVFYKQERIGKNGKPFIIYKFRSMYIDAEKYGPQLSKDNDPRITGWGRFLRKSRLDELPQFWNVLKGDMSVVGPRPERQHYINQIIEHKPHYAQLLCLKPGITSIGQVYYGYAENIEQMCERVNYDINYLEKVNIHYDVTIILRTVKIMVQGKGK